MPSNYVEWNNKGHHASGYLAQLFVVQTFDAAAGNATRKNKSPWNTLGQKPTFYPESDKNLMFEKCEFCEKEVLKM